MRRLLQLVPISCLAAFVVLPLVLEYLADHDLPQFLGCSVIVAAIGLAMALGALPDPPCPR